MTKTNFQNLRLKLAQAQEAVEEASKNVSKPQDSNIAKEKINQLHEKASEFLGSEKVAKWLEDQVDEQVSPHVNQFIKNNKDKLEQYRDDPELIIQDASTQLPIQKTIDTILMAMNTAFIATSIYSVAITIMSGGLAGVATIPAEAAKWFTRKKIKQFLASRGKKMILKRFAKKVLKKIRKIGLPVATNIGKHFMRSAAFHTGTILIGGALSAIGKDVALTTIKNTILRNSDQWKIPKPMLDKLVKAPDRSAFDRILEDFQKKAKEDFIELYSTEPGFKKLAYGAAFSKFFEMRGIDSVASKLIIQQNIQAALRDPINLDPTLLKNTLTKKLDRKKYKNYKDKLEKKKQDLFDSKDEDQAIFSPSLVKEPTKPETSIDEKVIKQMVEASSIPSIQHKIYIEELEERIDGQSKEEAIDTIDKFLSYKDIVVEDLIEAMKDQTAIELLQTKSNPTPALVSRALRQTLDTELSLNELMQQYEVSSIDQLLQAIASNKEVSIKNLTKQLLLKPRTANFKDNVVKQIAEQAGLDKYRKDMRFTNFRDFTL